MGKQPLNNISFNINFQWAHHFLNEVFIQEIFSEFFHLLFSNFWHISCSLLAPSRLHQLHFLPLRPGLQLHGDVSNFHWEQYRWHYFFLLFLFLYFSQVLMRPPERRFSTFSRSSTSLWRLWAASPWPWSRSLCWARSRPCEPEIISIKRLLSHFFFSSYTQ